MTHNSITSKVCKEVQTVPDKCRGPSVMQKNANMTLLLTFLGILDLKKMNMRYFETVFQPFLLFMYISLFSRRNNLLQPPPITSKKTSENRTNNIIRCKTKRLRVGFCLKQNDLFFIHCRPHVLQSPIYSGAPVALET